MGLDRRYASVCYAQGKFSVRKLWLNLTDLNLVHTNMQRKHTEIYLVFSRDLRFLCHLPFSLYKGANMEKGVIILPNMFLFLKKFVMLTYKHKHSIH